MIRFFETLLFGHKLYFVSAAAVIRIFDTIATVDFYRRVRREEGTAWLDTACPVTKLVAEWITQQWAPAK